MSRLTDLMMQNNTSQAKQSEDSIKNLEYQTQKIRHEEKVIRSYGANPGTLLAPEADKLIERGMAKKGERVCLNCYKITKTEYTKCKTCKHIQYENYRIACRKYYASQVMKEMEMK